MSIIKMLNDTDTREECASPMCVMLVEEGRHTCVGECEKQGNASGIIDALDAALNEMEFRMGGVDWGVK